MSHPTDPNILMGEDSRYDSAGDAHMRLTKTVVRFEGNPIYIIEVKADNKLLAWNMLPEQNFHGEYSYNDRRLDISSIPLGFINHKGEGFYATRSPTRSQKQGVNPQNLFYGSMTPSKTPYGLGVNNDFIISFGQMCRGEYPDLEEVVDRSLKGNSAAFSKTWGIRKTKDNSLFILHHKVNPVGVFVKSENLFLFQKDELNTLRERSLKNVLSNKKIGSYNVETSGL